MLDKMDVGTAHGTERIARAIEDLIHDAQALLDSTRDRSSWHHGAMHQRLAEARALVRQAQVVLELVRARS